MCPHNFRLPFPERIILIVAPQHPSFHLGGLQSLGVFDPFPRWQYTVPMNKGMFARKLVKRQNKDTAYPAQGGA